MTFLKSWIMRLLQRLKSTNRWTWATSTSRLVNTIKQSSTTGWHWIRLDYNDYNDDDSDVGDHGDDADDDDDHLWLGQPSHHDKIMTMMWSQVPNTHKTMRIKIMHNIGVLFVKMGQSLDTLILFPHSLELSFTKVNFNLHLPGQYNDACSSFEWIMSEQVPPHRPP